MAGQPILGQVLRPIGEAPDAWRAFTHTIKTTGSRLVQQLIHLGVHVDSTISEYAPVAPASGPSWVASQSAIAACDRKLDTIAEAFIKRAVEAHDVGFDGIELFANYQGLLEQFWTAALINVEDRPSLDVVCRLSAAVCRGIRAQCGNDFLIGMAVSATEVKHDTLQLSDIIEIVKWHDEKGLIDYVSCGSGSYRNGSSIVPPALQTETPPGHFLVQALQGKLNAAIQIEVGLHTVDDAHAALKSGADLVSLVRPMICEPHWVSHVQNVTLERIRPCTACNQACIGRRARDLWVSCVSNPRAGREHALPPPVLASNQKMSPRAFILGGGVAGMEAARVLAQRGWQVRLTETQNTLGGKVTLMALLPGLERYTKLLKWYEDELRRLGVEIILQQTLTVHEASKEAEKFGASALIVATGAGGSNRPFQRANPAPISIKDSVMNLVPVENLLRAPPPEGTRILLTDDTHDHRGLTTACYLQDKGLLVELVTSVSTAGGNLMAAGLQTLLRRRFAEAGGRTHCDLVLQEWNHGNARLFNIITGESFTLCADTLAWSSSDYANLDSIVNDANLLCVFIGDVGGSRNAELAILEAHRVALSLEPTRR